MFFFQTVQSFHIVIMILVFVFPLVIIISVSVQWITTGNGDAASARPRPSIYKKKVCKPVCQCVYICFITRLHLSVCIVCVCLFLLLWAYLCVCVYDHQGTLPSMVQSPLLSCDHHNRSVLPRIFFDICVFPMLPLLFRHMSPRSLYPFSYWSIQWTYKFNFLFFNLI